MKKNAGFTFIEIMVCVIILTTGLLGLMGLQATALKGSVGAYNRSQATFLARTIADKMRLNFIADPNRTDAQQSINESVMAIYIYSPTPPAIWKLDECAKDQVGNDCTPVKRAKSDMYTWKRITLKNGLPMGTNIAYPARITCAADGSSNVCDGDGDVFTVSISWDENRNGKIDNRDSINPTAKCFSNFAIPTLNPQPNQYDPCFRMEFRL